jgi:hypothetical protein
MRESDWSSDVCSSDLPVRYRLYYVSGPGVIRDVITGWDSLAGSDKRGRIQGQISLQGSNSPVVNALVTAAGMQTTSASDGSFLLEGLSIGTHNLVVYDMNGAFQTFQQGAVVAADSTTPATIQVIPNETVNITFLVIPPATNLQGIPIRMVGNILALGNTFADLDGGMSIVPSRAPLLSILPDGRYSISLKLPVGLDLRYKYTLGDGFWNAEISDSGETRLRQLLVPDHDVTVNEVIDAWNSTGQEQVTFTVSVPSDTPATDTISIQFNPFTWTEPIPMWPAGDIRWVYILYNTISAIHNATYRYCRNDQCGTGDSTDTRGSSAPGMPFKPANEEQKYDDTIASWAWMEKKTDPVVVPAVNIQPREEGFIAGVEFTPDYDPSWQPKIPLALQNVRDIGSNTVILSPTWHMTHQTPPAIEAIPGRDALWPDLSQMVIQAQQKELGVIIHPYILYTEDPGKWWIEAARNDGWWQSWFDRYRTFLLNYADLAAQTGARTLIIGDENILPALPNGFLADGTTSNVPSDASERWQKIIQEVRERYTGKLAWFIPYSGANVSVPDFVRDLDGIYIQLSAPLIASDEYNQADLEVAFTSIIDLDILELYKNFNESIVIGLKVPSIQGILDGCVDADGSCLPMNGFYKPAGEYPNTVLDLKVQSDAYTALLTVVNQKPWISGVYSVGYYPPISLIDNSFSIHGKTASDVLWYWYPRLLGN